MTKIKLKPGVNEGVSNAEYHGDTTHFSSSTLKLLLKDRKKFYKEYILGEREQQEDKPAFALGSLVHTLILEPHLEDVEYVYLPDEIKSRRGAAFEAFMSEPENQGKTAIIKSQRELAKDMLEHYKKRPEAVNLINVGGKPEETLCVELEGVPIKVRADWVNVDKGYIVDVKTSSKPIDKGGVIDSCNQYEYYLSAALYKIAFEKHYNKKFDFYWIFLGKFEKGCEVYKMSDKSYWRGESDVRRAIEIYKECSENNNWEDYIIQEI